MLTEFRMPWGLGLGVSVESLGGSEWSIALLEKGAAEDPRVVDLTLFNLLVHNF